MTKQELELAEKKGLFEDFSCPNCDKPNKINWRKEKVRADGVWYYCEHCEWLDVVGNSIVEEIAK